MHAYFASLVLLSAFVRKHRCFFYLTALGLFLFAALRYGFGNDYFSYYRCFLEIRQMGENPFVGEVLYTAFNHLLPHYYWLIALSSLALVGSICFLILRSVPEKWMWLSFAVLLFNPYLFLMNLSAIRQSLALTCFIWAVPFACRRKPWPYCLLILAACGFHNSAVVLFPVYFVLTPTPVSRRTTLIIAFGTAVLLALGHLLYQVLTSALSLLQLSRYQHVLSDGMHNSLRATLLSSVTFFYLLWNLPRLRGNTLMYAKLWLIGSILSILAYRMSMLTRIEMYFDLFSVAAFPRILTRPKQDSRTDSFISNVLLPVAILLILLLRYHSFFSNPMWESFFTYRTILSAAH